jgi:hypothetical protein
MMMILEEISRYSSRIGFRAEEDHFIQRDHQKLCGVAAVAAQRIVMSLPLVAASLGNAITLSDASQPTFNYYPCSTAFSPHQDNLFGAPYVAVLNLGAAACVEFRHWCEPTTSSFHIDLPRRSAYIMSGLFRYEYTHGGRATIVKGRRSTTGGDRERVSLVWPLFAPPGTSSFDSILLSESAAWGWGESDQRSEAEGYMGRKMNLPSYMSFLDSYL